ncbi:MAG: glycosyltransferase family 2 protein, partial [Flavobacteriaceae bacterium]
DGNGTFLPESKRNIPLPRIALKILLGNSSTYYATQVGEQEIGRTPILVGAFMLVKKEVFKRVNGFDEDYFMYGEDIDISYKIHSLGYDNYYNGTTSIVHFKGESTLKDNKYAAQFYGAMQIFYKKHFKSNIVFDAIVWLGIRMAYVFRSKHKDSIDQTESYILVSDKIPDQLIKILQKPIRLDLDLECINENTEVILDANLLKYEKIIAYLTNHKINSKAKFKILPKNSNFIIGSNSSKSRGEVILF